MVIAVLNMHMKRLSETPVMVLYPEVFSQPVSFCVQPHDNYCYHTKQAIRAILCIIPVLSRDMHPVMCYFPLQKNTQAFD